MLRFLKIKKIWLSLIILLLISLLFWIHHLVIIKEMNYSNTFIPLGDKKVFITDIYLQNYEVKHKTKWLESIGLPKTISNPLNQILSFYSFRYKKYSAGGILTLNGLIVTETSNGSINPDDISLRIIDRYGNNLLIGEPVFYRKNVNTINFSLKGIVKKEHKEPFGIDIKETASGKHVKTYFDKDWSIKYFSFFDEKPNSSLSQPQEFINEFLQSYVSQIKKNKNTNSTYKQKTSSFPNLQHNFWLTNKWAITSISYLNEYDGEPDVFETNVNFFSSKPESIDIIATQKIYVVRSNISNSGWLIFDVGPVFKCPSNMPL